MFPILTLDMMLHVKVICLFSFLFSPDAMMSSWIYKTSSLPFLCRFHAANNHFELLTGDENKRTECNGELEFNQEDSAIETNHHIRVTSSEKKSLIIKRLVPLGISLLILGAAVFVRFYVPLPPSNETATVDNKTVGGNITGNFTTQAPVLTELHWRNVKWFSCLHSLM